MKKSGFVAIIGLPNAGKSTLMNTLLGKSISIVTHKPNTTRDIIYGIKTNSNSQMVFLDTPGVLTPHNSIQDKMLSNAKESIKMSDVIVLVIDISQEYKKNIIDELILKYFHTKTILVLNKIDLIKNKEERDRKISFFKTLAGNVKNRILISAKDNIGLKELEDIIIDSLPEGDYIFPKEMESDKPPEFFAAEIIRKYILLNFKKEVPYGVTVEIEEFYFKKKTLYISAVVVVKKKGQKGILIGKNGMALKKVGVLARKEMENIYKKHIYLKQYVKYNYV